jgi:predicted RNase H-like HicB family nuclease
VEEFAMQVTAILTPAEEGGYVALNPETGTTTQGETVEEALANLREAVELFLEDEPMKLSGAPLVTTLTIKEHA